MNSIFETAATLPNIEGEAAMQQLLIEACSQFEGVEPMDFSFSEGKVDGTDSPAFFLDAKMSEPWPYDVKKFSGIGTTPEEAYNSLISEMNECFQPLVCLEVIETEKAA